MNNSGPVFTTVSALVQGLKPSSGENWVGFCPIHGETPGKSKPSFSVNMGTGQWNCFTGCGGGGLPQLLKSVGRSSAFIDRTMERLRPFLRVTKQKTRSVTSGGLFITPYPLPERILGLFEYAAADLLRDGFDERVMFESDVGYDPVHEHITYAIRDLHGTLAGIVGKPSDPGAGGKYRVYEREIVDMGFRGYHFENRRMLWGWERVYPAVYFAENPGPVYVTEGYKARLWLLQHGYTNTVALMGTGLGATQQMFLERLGTKVILCLDNDPAGRVGTAKISYKLRGLDVGIMRYPYPELKLQPDDLTVGELEASLKTPMTTRQWRQIYHEHYHNS